MRSIEIAVIAILCFTLRVGAQIPIPCVGNYNLSNPGECCPEAIVNGQSTGKCGSLANRGQCVPVTDQCNTAYSSNVVNNQDKACRNLDDSRLNWPSKLFSHVCKCEEKYGDYDCGMCAYGYAEDSEQECVPDLLPRRSITSLSDQEWADYVQLLNTTKQTISTRYVVITESGGTTGITTYNLFIWFHHYAAKDHLEKGYGQNDSGKMN